MNRGAIQAAVAITVGTQRLTRVVNPSSSYLSSNDSRVHFGLGARDNVDRIAVTWSDGAQEHFESGLADRMLTLVRGHGTNLDVSKN
jgi:hypothetical protein